MNNFTNNADGMYQQLSNCYPVGMAPVAPIPTMEQQLAATQHQLLSANGCIATFSAKYDQLERRYENVLMENGRLKAEKNNNPSFFAVKENNWTHINGKGKRTPVAYVIIENVKYINIKEDGTFDCLYAVYIAADEKKE